MAAMPNITISFAPEALAAIDTLAAAMVAIKVNDDAVRSMREVEQRMRIAEEQRDQAQKQQRITWGLYTALKAALEDCVPVEQRRKINARMAETAALLGEGK